MAANLKMKMVEALLDVIASSMDVYGMSTYVSAGHQSLISVLKDEADMAADIKTKIV